MVGTLTFCLPLNHSVKKAKTVFISSFVMLLHINKNNILFTVLLALCKLAFAGTCVNAQSMRGLSSDLCESPQCCVVFILAA